jgi:hypothetical protein
LVYETHLEVKLSSLGAVDAVLCVVRLLLLLLLFLLLLLLLLLLPPPLLAYIFIAGGAVIMATQKLLRVRGSSVTAIGWHHWK